MFPYKIYHNISNRDVYKRQLGDCLKCVVAILVAKLLFASHQGEDLLLLELYAGAGCILGHNFPFYLKFKGGKGIAASVGLYVYKRQGQSLPW